MATLSVDKFFYDVSLYDAGRENPAKRGTYLYDLPMNYAKQYAAGIRIAFIKSSEWTIDPAFRMNWQVAGLAGMIRGAYHYFHPNLNAITQAQNYLKIVNDAGLTWTGDKRNSDKLIVDLETDDTLDAVSVMKAVASFYYEVHKALPQFEFVIYSGPGFWNKLRFGGASTSWVADTSLWQAGYPFDPTPSMEHPPAVFDGNRTMEIANAVYNNVYKDVPLVGWKSIAYRQFTGHADTKYVIGHPGLKLSADVNVCLVDIPARTPVLPIPVQVTPLPTTAPLNPAPGPAEATVGSIDKRLVALETYARQNGWKI